MSRKVYLIDLEGFWLGVRRNIVQFKWYLAFYSIMSMLQNFVLTKFQIYLTYVMYGGFSVSLATTEKCWSHLIVDNDQRDRKIAPHLLSPCGLIGDTAITLPKIVIKSGIRFSQEKDVVCRMGDLIKQIKDIFCTFKFNSVESSLSDLIRPPFLICIATRPTKKKEGKF